jgi:hypothetical protein
MFSFLCRSQGLVEASCVLRVQREHSVSHWRCRCPVHSTCSTTANVRTSCLKANSFTVHAVKTYVVGEVYVHLFLISQLHSGDLSALRPGRFTRRKGPQYPVNTGLDGPQKKLYSWSGMGYDSFFHGATARSGPGPPHGGGFTITLRHITRGRTPLDE